MIRRKRFQFWIRWDLPTIRLMNQDTIRIYERLNENAAVNMELGKSRSLVKGSESQTKNWKTIS